MLLNGLQQTCAETLQAELPCAFLLCFCVPQGVKVAPACEEASVRAFPTWVIGGSVTEGQLDLNALEELLTQAQGSSSSTEAAAVAAAQ